DAVDGNAGAVLTYTLVEGPIGMEVAPGTGVVTFTAGAAAVGPQTVRIRVTDETTLFDEQSYTLTVLTGNDAPHITSVPVTEGTVDQGYAYDVSATDPERLDVLRFSLTTAPSGMVIQPVSGVIQWIPDVAGTFPVTVRVTDLAGAYDEQAYAIAVDPDDHAPRITLTADPVRFAPGGSTTLTVTVDDPYRVTTSLTIDAVPVPLDASGPALYSTLVPGVHRAVATAVDGTGNTAVARLAISVDDGSDTTTPVVEITTPADSATLTYIEDVIGTASDDNLAEYTLAVRRSQTSDDFVQFSRGESSVTAALLGVLDTTQHSNGFYDLRLRAEDVAGHTAEVVVPVRIDGQAKIGVVRFSVVDMALPLLGVPIAVIRSYDSTRATEQGDFGYGWRMEIKAGSVQHNRPVGYRNIIWTRHAPPDPPEFPCQQTTEQLPHYTEVRLSEDEWYLFKPIVVNTDPVGGTCTGDVFFEQVDGTTEGAELRVIGNTRVRSTALPPSPTAPTFEGHLYDAFTEEIFDPHSLQLVTEDGRIVDVTVEGGVNRLSDPNDNTLFIGTPPGRGFGGLGTGDLVHSGGRRVLVERDDDG
ncbi:MAG: RHS repeat-associated core domain-containing protein, partial [Acidimicrobiaceae bacterium]